MTRLSTLVLVGLTLVILNPLTLSARIMIDAPHNESNSMACESCHGDTVLESAYWDPESTQTVYDQLCKSCHTKKFGPYTAAAAPYELTHSAEVTESDDWGGTWSKQCIDCHNPHTQEQKNWMGTDSDKLYLATGRIVSFIYDSDSNTTILTFDQDYPAVDDGITYKNEGTGFSNEWNASRLSAKTSEYTRTMIFPDKLNTKMSYPVIEVFEAGRTITINGDASNVWIYKDPPTDFFVIYGQLIKTDIKFYTDPTDPETLTGTKTVKFFDSSGTGSFADGDGINGICEVCHTQTGHYRNDGTNPTHNDLESNPVVTTETNCIDCHRHTVGFAHKTDGTGDTCGTCHNTGSHIEHLSLGVYCSGCHDLDNMWAEPGVINDPSTRPDDPKLCERCHNDGTGCDDNDTPLNLTDDVCTEPNDTDFRINWTVPGYTLNCDGCHNGRPDTFDANLLVLWDSPDELLGADSEMSSNAHDRLIGEEGIRQYPCWYCHGETIRGYTDDFDAILRVDTRWDNWEMTDKHVNGIIDVNISPKWDIPGMDDPYFIPGTKNCFNTYCHSDGTTRNPEIRIYPWDDGPKVCNSCHGHNPFEQSCLDCHPHDPRDMDQACNECHEEAKIWGEKDEWLTAMPMYTNTGPGTDRANSHFRHLFSGFSCDDCHFNTVGGACLDCHVEGIPNGQMSDDEASHIDGNYHVNKLKDVDFKDGGTYYRTKQGEHPAMSCANTACHTGEDPVWGDSIGADITCLECHGTSGPDVDDFGAFDGSQAKISMTDWMEAGHGRPALDGEGDPNPYLTGNPAADFPTNGCWYCHDSDVLHEDETNPFRLKLHWHFDYRFDKECAYCHMEETDEECLGCHNDSETLAPQLVDLPALPGVINNPPYSIERTDHTLYADGLTSCSNGTTCHETTDTLHHVEVPSLIQTADQINDIKNQYVMMGVCLKCHDDDSGGQCQTCHAGDEYVTGFDPDVPGLDFIQPQQAIASSFHFGYKHYEGYSDSISLVSDNGITDDPPFINSQARDTTQDWEGVDWQDHYLRMTGGFNSGERRLISGNDADTIHVSPSFLEIIANGDTFDILDSDLGYVTSGTVDAPPESTNILQDTTKSWTTDEWFDQYDTYHVLIVDGPNAGITRPIKTNTGDTITMGTDFPAPVTSGITYQIINPVWKGGKFCWDCHDPHGDVNPFSTNEFDKYNIFMVQEQIATETDGLYGKPIPSARVPVKFSRNQTGMDYANSEAPFNGICNVCHDDTPGKTQHFNKSAGDGHNAARKCTLCHEHRFTDSHANQESCDSCHGQKPVPRHTAFGLPRDCTKCHDGTIKGRMNIMGQFSAPSHHVQRDDGSVTNKDCYSCHWEATEVGLISLEYHTGYNYETHVTVENDPIDLVRWGPGERPTVYDTTGGTAGYVTVTTFRASNLTGTLEEHRAEITKITPHCLSCHSDQNNDTDSFGVLADGDCKTPRQYAWDGYSIDAKYSDLTTTTWGKYTGVTNAVKKDLTKAYSGHGNAINNGGGFNAVTGPEGTVTDTRPGTRFNVQCFDCHNSHGSYVEGITSSYATYNGTKNGANLKETQGGKGGYEITYKASAWPDPNAVNPYNAGAGQCFDCHENETGSPAAGNTKPWGYASTYEASQPIIGYKDNLRFSGTYNGILESGSSETNNVGHTPTSDTNVDLTYREVRTTLGGHQNASHNNPASPNYNIGDPSVNDVPTTEVIDGLCTPCHDPHGVSPTLGSKMQYGVPLLKGTWLTSPYKEDHPPPNPYDNQTTANYIYENYWGWPRYKHYPSNSPDQYQPWSGRNGWAPTKKPETRYNIDRNTFDDVANNNTFITETEEEFAGLCLRCHPKEYLTNELVDDQNFRTVDRIHETVKGWGGNNNEHYFSCSKCHKPHSSGLPRLMTTNCLDYNHRGGVESGGVPQKRYSGSRGYPIAHLFEGSSEHQYQNECHAKATAAGTNPYTWPSQQRWNDVTLW